jgi:hypothetical protein
VSEITHTLRAQILSLLSELIGNFGSENRPPEQPPQCGRGRRATLEDLSAAP